MDSVEMEVSVHIHFRDQGLPMDLEIELDRRMQDLIKSMYDVIDTTVDSKITSEYNAKAEDAYDTWED